MSLKIVLADDSLTAQNMGKKILAEAGYQVIAVSNGAQAMKKIVSEKPDLVVLDVYMPGYTGLELCERMRNSRETARTPVVLTVGKMEAFKPEEANRVGADGLIIKPFEATELVAVVKKLAQNLSPATRPESQPQPESVPQIVEPTPAPVEPEFEVQHHAVQVPREIASDPVIGMDLIPVEAQEPAAAQPAAVAHSSAPPIEFEVERDAAPVEIDPGPRMTSAAGLSGVFEMEPAAHPAVESPAEPAPGEEFERFSAAIPAEPQPDQEAAADTGAVTIAHDFQVHDFQTEEPLEFVDELAADHHTAPAVETWSAPAEPLDQAQPEPAVENVTPQPADVLPELASWDEPVPASPSLTTWETEQSSPELPAQDLRLSADPAPDSSAVQFAAGSVWVAEETEIDPHESAISLHEQMQQAEMVDELPESDAAASPAASAEASQSWEVPEPVASAPAQPESESSGPSEEQILPEFEPNPYAAPVQPAELESTGPYDRSDFHADLAAGSEPQPAVEPAPTPDFEPYGASEFVPRIAVPIVTEIPADPVRIARIVEEALQRLKPELIAAVTRELENKNQ
ncbi:MAG: response regulator [Terriglobales bacterium]